MKLQAGTFEQQIADYSPNYGEAEKLECHGCKETKEDCVSKDDTICCPECSPYWDEWCDSYNEGLIEWCEFNVYVRGKKDGNN